MAYPPSQANSLHSLVNTDFATPAPFLPNHGSVAMEPSVSSSSATSFLTSTSSTSAQSSNYMPTTPKRMPAALDHINNNQHTASFAAKDHAAFTMALPTKKPLDISNLMSPPEPDQLDSFSINDDDGESRRGSIASADMVSSSHIRSSDKALAVPKNGPISPPVSPKNQKPVSSPTDATSDPILYPASSDTSPLSTQSRPLFPEAATAATGDVVSSHVAARSPTLFQRATPPRGEDYELALYLKAEVMQSYLVNPRDWLKKEREQLLADRRAAADRDKRLQLSLPTSKPASLPAPRNLTPRILKAHFMPQESLLSHQSVPLERERLPSLHPVHNPANRIVKRANRAPTAARSSLPARLAPHVNGVLRQVSGGSHGNGRVPGSSPEPRTRTTAPNREDKDFMSLPDHCPPLSSLPERTNNLKVDWKGTALDLSRDPHLHLLHRDEVGLAASLRLDCATYLTSKRRIFIRRLECARIGKEFRKTDAQQACKIDVNKASKLWTAYEKVGWLRIEHVRPFL